MTYVNGIWVKTSDNSPDEPEFDERYLKCGYCHHFYQIGTKNYCGIINKAVIIGLDEPACEEHFEVNEDFYDPNASTAAEMAEEIERFKGIIGE
jgi:hypothetical protein